ncbi:uncharacterized protein LOC134221390 [Armigeres subalbatus]|uniref:uncharacterized protein LOC134221390 n=1 Tax=Armigeres subalbatus TaxID=124917 RepID=UPI002ED3E959
MHTMCLAFFLLRTFTFSSGIVYVRVKNERGPTAVQAGINCLELLTDIFFYSTDSAQIQNLVMFHLDNLSSPSREIELGYLQNHHTGYEEKVYGGKQIFQLKLMSDVLPLDSLRRAQFIDHKLTDFYVIVADEMEKLYRAMHYVSSAYAFNPRGKFVILYNNPNDRGNESQFALEVLNLMFIGHHSVNVLVAFAVDMMTYNIYTGDPYHGTQNDCGQMKALKVATVANGTFRNRLLAIAAIRMPKVPAEMESCTFNLCTRVASPFINEGCETGLEIEIMRLLQESMKFNVNISCSTMERGELMDDDITWSDLLGKLRDDECDIIAGSFYPDYDVHMDFAGTSLYYQDYYTWFVELAGLESRWKVLLIIFEIPTWELIALTLLISSISWFLIGSSLPETHAHKVLSTCFLNTWCVLLGISTSNRPMYNSLRIFFIALALYGLNLTTIYTSLLINFFASPPRKHQIDTMDEILAANFQIGGRMEYEDWFQNGDENDLQVSRLYDNSDDFQPSHENLKAVFLGERVVLASRMYVKSSHFKDNVHGLNQDTFATQLEMIMEKGFPLLPKFNRIISNLNDMGITEKLFHDFMFNVTILEKIEDILNPDDDDHSLNSGGNEIVLTTDHLQSAFFFFFVGVVISTVVFFGEVIYNTTEVKKIVKRLEGAVNRFLVRLKLREPRWKPVGVLNVTYFLVAKRADGTVLTCCVKSILLIKGGAGFKPQDTTQESLSQG